MEQRALFERVGPLDRPSAFCRVPPAVCRATDPPTSQRAARSAAVAPLSGAILRFLARVADATCEEISDGLSIKRDLLVSVSPRLKPLMVLGWIEKTGDERAGRSTRKRYVVRITDAGREALGRIADQAIDAYLEQGASL